MSEHCLNLSGQWDGVFSYPDVPEAGPVTPFVANLLETGGVVKGSVIEPHEYKDVTAHATIIGQRIGNAVHFAKTYHGAGWAYKQTVLYTGTLSENGECVSGEWRIDHWCGAFEMTRDPIPAEEVEATESVELEADR